MTTDANSPAKPSQGAVDKPETSAGNAPKSSAKQAKIAPNQATSNPSARPTIALPKVVLPLAQQPLLEAGDFTAGRLYWFLLLVLLIVILVAGVKNVTQVQARHALYHELSQARSEYQTLMIEEQRLLIEQQTFSATPIVAQRAANELFMYYPSDHERVAVLAPNN